MSAQVRRADVEELAAALLAVIDLPDPATYEDELKRRADLDNRVSNVIGALQYLAKNGSGYAVRGASQVLRERPGTPLRYAAIQPEEMTL